MLSWTMKDAEYAVVDSPLNNHDLYFEDYFERKDDGGSKVEEKSAISKPKNKSSVSSASFNFINSIVGAGIIGIPYALKETGFVVG